MNNYLAFFLLLAVAWSLQLYLTSRQARVFMREVGQLRRLGATAVGTSSGGWLSPKVYVVLAAGDDERVIAARRLRGVTVMARPQPLPGVEGGRLIDLAGREGADGTGQAVAVAARHLLERGTRTGADKEVGGQQAS